MRRANQASARTMKQESKTAAWPMAQISAYLPIKDHLVTFPVFDLVVEVLRQLQAFIDLSLEADSALAKKKAKYQPD